MVRLDGLDGTDVRVAVVDSGIRVDHPHLPPPAGGIAIGSGARDEVPAAGSDGSAAAPGSAPPYVDTAGHGTACAGIIHEIAPGAALYAVRVLAADLTATAASLVEALAWVADQRMDVANLSLGSAAPQDGELAAACERAARAGVILVAAHHNQGCPSLPAACSQVISVGAAAGLGARDYVLTGQDDPELLARGDPQRVCWLDPDYVLLDGTSFAAARIAGLVALIRQAIPGASLAEVRRQLSLGALRPAALPSRRAAPDARPLARAPAPARHGSCAWLGRAVLYPFNKEMHALVRARELLDFRIAAVVDPVGKGLVGKDAAAVLGLPAAGLPIQANLARALGEADSLVLGCVDRLGRAARRDILREAASLALAAGKHVFSLLPAPAETYPDLHELAARSGAFLHWADTTAEDVSRALQAAASAPAPTVPVLGVFGTSSRQGKFTLQLILRQQLLARGYAVAQIATEPHAELFGMDLAFPIGYGSPLRLPLQTYVPFLRASLRCLCAARQPDIVLVGGQSGTIPYDVERVATHTLATLAFLLGTQPDACVLVVNAGDPEAYVEDTLQGLRAVAHCPVLALAMPDRDPLVRSRIGRRVVGSRSLSPAAVRCHCSRLERHFGLPAACIADPADQQRLVEILLAHFGAAAAAVPAATGRQLI